MADRRQRTDHATENRVAIDAFGGVACAATQIFTVSIV